MKSSHETIFLCKTQAELDERRNDCKWITKKAGTFLNCKGNTIYCKDGIRYTFKLEEPPIPKDVDEPLPKEAFPDNVREIARKAARDLIE